MYTATKLKASLILEPWGDKNQISLVFERQKLKLDKTASAPACSKRVKLSAPFGYQDQGSGHGPGWGEGQYIFGHLV